MAGVDLPSPGEGSGWPDRVLTNQNSLALGEGRFGGEKGMKHRSAFQK